MLVLAPSARSKRAPTVFVTVIQGLASDLLIVAAMLHDRRSRGRVHSVYWLAGGALLALQLLRVPLSTSAAWLSTFPL